MFGGVVPTFRKSGSRFIFKHHSVFNGILINPDPAAYGGKKIATDDGTWTNGKSLALRWRAVDQASDQVVLGRVSNPRVITIDCSAQVVAAPGLVIRQYARYGYALPKTNTLLLCYQSDVALGAGVYNKQVWVKVFDLTGLTNGATLTLAQATHTILLYEAQTQIEVITRFNNRGDSIAIRYNMGAGADRYIKVFTLAADYSGKTEHLIATTTGVIHTETLNDPDYLITDIGTEFDHIREDGDGFYILETVYNYSTDYKANEVVDSITYDLWILPTNLCSSKVISNTHTQYATRPNITQDDEKITYRRFITPVLVAGVVSSWSLSEPVQLARVAMHRASNATGTTPQEGFTTISGRPDCGLPYTTGSHYLTQADGEAAIAFNAQYASSTGSGVLVSEYLNKAYAIIYTSKELDIVLKLVYEDASVASDMTNPTYFPRYRVYLVQQSGTTVLYTYNFTPNSSFPASLALWGLMPVNSNGVRVVDVETENTLMVAIKPSTIVAADTNKYVFTMNKGTKEYEFTVSTTNADAMFDGLAITE